MTPARSCRVVSSPSAWWAALLPSVSLPARFSLGLEILVSFVALSATPARAAVLVVTVLSALGAVRRGVQLDGDLVIRQGAGRNFHLLCLPCPIWPDSNNRLYSVVEMTTKQHSTSTQSPLQGNVSPGVSGQESWWCSSQSFATQMKERKT